MRSFGACSGEAQASLNRTIEESAMSDPSSSKACIPTGWRSSETLIEEAVAPLTGPRAPQQRTRLEVIALDGKRCGRTPCLRGSSQHFHALLDQIPPPGRSSRTKRIFKVRLQPSAALAVAILRVIDPRSKCGVQDARRASASKSRRWRRARARASSSRFHGCSVAAPVRRSNSLNKLPRCVGDFLTAPGYPPVAANCRPLKLPPEVTQVRGGAAGEGSRVRNRRAPRHVRRGAAWLRGRGGACAERPAPRGPDHLLAPRHQGALRATGRNQGVL
eukprot:scaffold127904_cov63-Phaeocystis_antarctica.AAC.2